MVFRVHFETSKWIYQMVNFKMRKNHKPNRYYFLNHHLCLKSIFECIHEFAQNLMLIVLICMRTESNYPAKLICKNKNIILPLCAQSHPKQCRITSSLLSVTQSDFPKNHLGDLFSNKFLANWCLVCCLNYSSYLSVCLKWKKIQK